MGSRITLGSIAGIEIRIHRSWFLIALLIAWSFWGRFTLDDRGTAAALIMAVVGAALFFGSILAHELAHSLEAQHRGVQVHGITLFLFGGATETPFDVERPRDEFALTAVGPFSSLVLAAAFGLLATYSDAIGLGAVAEVAGLLGWINLALGIFNLLPGAPLDGGRILRSAVWAVTGDRRRAARVAARSGQVIGLFIGTLGLLQLFFVPGALLGGIWFMFIGWTLASAAQGEVLQQELHHRLGGLTVGELLQQAELPGVDAGTDLADAAEQLRRQSEDALAVVDGGRTAGVVLLDDLAGVPAEERRRRSVEDLMVPIDDLPRVDGDAEVSDTLDELRSDRPFAVTDPTDGGGRVLGVITPEQLQRVINRTMRLGITGTDAGAPAADTHLPQKERR